MGESRDAGTWTPHPETQPLKTSGAAFKTGPVHHYHPLPHGRGSTLPTENCQLTTAPEILEKCRTPLQIGTRLLTDRFLLAPLAGYTHLAFRVVLRRLGGLGLATTDLVQATMLWSGHGRSRELVATTPEDRPLSVQIFSGRTEDLILRCSVAAGTGV